MDIFFPAAFFQTCNKALSYVVFVCTGCVLSTVTAFCFWQPFSVVPTCLYPYQQVIPEGLLIFVWVQQHSIKLVKYTQGSLSQPERLRTYMSPSNRCSDYGLQLAPEEWLKQPVSQEQARPSRTSIIVLFYKVRCSKISQYWVLCGACFFIYTVFKHLYIIIKSTMLIFKSAKCILSAPGYHFPLFALVSKLWVCNATQLNYFPSNSITD